MKKIFTVVMAVAFAFSVAGFAVAADNAAKSAPAKREAAPMAKKAAKGQKVSGTIEALDAAAGTFSVKGKKGNVDLKAGENVQLGDFNVGDKLSLIHISEPTRLGMISYAVFCLKKKN